MNQCISHMNQCIFRQCISRIGAGVWGQRIQVDSTWNVYFNDTGTTNGCKAGDLKVTCPN